MKNSKLIYYYVASSLAMLVPVPGRFAYGIYILILFNLQMLSTSIIFHAVEHIKLSKLRNSVISFAMIAVTIFYKQLLTIYCPVAAITLGFCMYLPALTSAVIEFFFIEYSKGGKEHIALTMKKSLFMSAVVMIYYLLRDIIGYGTITLPAWKKLFVIHLPYNPESTSASVFMATIPGSLIFIAVSLSLYIVYQKKHTILDNSPVNLEEA